MSNVQDSQECFDKILAIFAGSRDEGQRRSEPLDDIKSEGNASFESAAQYGRMHTALPLQAESTELPLTGRGQAVTVRWSTKKKQATLETPPWAQFFRTPRAPKDVCAT